MKKLVIKNLHVTVDNKKILNGVNLTVNEGDNIALLGPNGHGKSTLFMSIMGHPKYKITHGSISFNNKDIKNKTTNIYVNLHAFV